MARFDTKGIEGFDTMTAEEKVAALLEVEIPEEVDMRRFVSKDMADKYASEAAELKKQLRSKMTDDEAAKAKAEADRLELQEKYDALIKKTTISEYKAKYLAMGYDEKLATATATALADGDIETVFANSEKFMGEMEKKIKAELLKGTPRPDAAGGEGKPMTREDIMRIKDPTERQRAIAANLELYGKEN